MFDKETTVMVVGDTHGYAYNAVRYVGRCADLGLNTIIQVGDFGLWDHIQSGVWFLDDLNDSCVRNDVVVYFLDGNHENHKRLAAYQKFAPKHETIDGAVHIRSNIVYLPRGTVWSLHDKTLMAVGGAVSIDRHFRTINETWWLEEEFTDEQLEAITSQADYLFTHDCPSNFPFPGRLIPDPDSVIHRQRMDRLGKIVQPKKWFHGHYHAAMFGYPFRHLTGVADVFGLAADGAPDSYLLLDIAADKVVTEGETYG